MLLQIEWVKIELQGDTAEILTLPPCLNPWWARNVIDFVTFEAFQAATDQGKKSQQAAMSDGGTRK